MGVKQGGNAPLVLLLPKKFDKPFDKLEKQRGNCYLFGVRQWLFFTLSHINLLMVLYYIIIDILSITF